MFPGGGEISPLPEQLGRILPLQLSGQGFKLEVDEQSTPTSFPTQQVAPGYLSRNGQGPLHSLQKESDRESKIQQVYLSSLLSPKEEFYGEQDHLGPVSPEPVHTAHLIQNADFEGGEDATSSWGLDYKHRSKGRLLAHVSSQSLSPLPRFQIQESELEVQGNAFWPQFGPENLYQIDKLLGTQNGRGEHMVSPIPGRSSDHCLFTTGLPSQNGKVSTDITIPGVDRKYGEIQTHSTTSLRVAGHPVQPEVIQSTKLNHPVPEVQLPVGDHFYTGLVNQMHPSGYPRDCELAGSSGPIAQDSLLSVKNFTESTEICKK